MLQQTPAIGNLRFVELCGAILATYGPGRKLDVTYVRPLDVALQDLKGSGNWLKPKNPPGLTNPAGSQQQPVSDIRPDINYMVARRQGLQIEPRGHRFMDSVKHQLLTDARHGGMQLKLLAEETD